MPSNKTDDSAKSKPDRTCDTCDKVFEFPSGLKRHQAKQSSPCYVAAAVAVDEASPDEGGAAANTAPVKSAPKKRARKAKGEGGLTAEERLQKQLALKDLQLELANDKLAQLKVAD
jgi:hypothetical protein